MARDETIDSCIATAIVVYELPRHPTSNGLCQNWADIVYFEPGIKKQQQKKQQH